MRNNKILAITLILATFLIAALSPLPSILVKSDDSNRVISIAASFGARTIATITHTALNITDSTYLLSVVELISGRPLLTSIPPWLHLRLPTIK